MRFLCDFWCDFTYKTCLTLPYTVFFSQSSAWVRKKVISYYYLQLLLTWRYFVAALPDLGRFRMQNRIKFASESHVYTVLSGGSRVVSVVSGNYLTILEGIHTRIIWTTTELFHCVSFCVFGNANAVFFGAPMQRFAHNSCDRTAKMRFSSVASHRSPLGGVRR